MDIRSLAGALIITGLLAFAAPSGVAQVQSSSAQSATAKSTAGQAGTTKHRYWRHRGGRHPHFGSRTPRTVPRASGK